MTFEGFKDEDKKMTAQEYLSRFLQELARIEEDNGAEDIAGKLMNFRHNIKDYSLPLSPEQLATEIYDIYEEFVTDEPSEL